MTYNELSGVILEVAIDIHRRLGPGLLESVYQTILAHELTKRGLQVQKEEHIPLIWDNLRFDVGFRADLIVNELIPLDQLDARYTSGLVIRISETDHASDILQRVREVLRAYPGQSDLQFCLFLENGSRVIVKAHAAKINVTRELRDRLENLLGPGNLQLITSPPKPTSSRYGSGPHRPAYQRVGAR